MKPTLAFLGLIGLVLGIPQDAPEDPPELPPPADDPPAPSPPPEDPGEPGDDPPPSTILTPPAPTETGAPGQGPICQCGYTYCASVLMAMSKSLLSVLSESTPDHKQRSRGLRTVLPKRTVRPQMQPVVTAASRPTMSPKVCSSASAMARTMTSAPILICSADAMPA